MPRTIYAVESCGSTDFGINPDSSNRQRAVTVGIPEGSQLTGTVHVWYRPVSGAQQLAGTIDLANISRMSQMILFTTTIEKLWCEVVNGCNNGYFLLAYHASVDTEPDSGGGQEESDRVAVAINSMSTYTHLHTGREHPTMLFVDETGEHREVDVHYEDNGTISVSFGKVSTGTLYIE